MKKVHVCIVLMFAILMPSGAFATDMEGIRKESKYSFSPYPKKRKKEKEEMSYKQVFSFYPIKALSNYMMVGYERQIGPKHALKIAAGYVNFEESITGNEFNFNFEIREFSGVRFDIGLKYFVGENNPVFNGIYFAPFLSFKNSKFRYNDFNNFQFPPPPVEEWEEGSATSLNAGFIFGYQLPLGESFSVDFYVGNVIKRSGGDYEQANRLFDAYRNSIGLTSGLTVGFGF